MKNDVYIFKYPKKYKKTVFGDFTKKTRAEISRRMHRFMARDLSYETDSGPKTKTVSDPNFQVTAATAAAATATSQQLSHLARALDHHAQGPNIPFGVIPHFDIVNCFYYFSYPRNIWNMFYFIEVRDHPHGKFGPWA